MITIIGSGIVGLTCADMLLNAGYNIQLITASNGVDDSLCSWWAGGMLAPFCEMESAEPLVGDLADISIRYWQQLSERADDCDYFGNGTLVVSPSRDQNMLKHFAQKTQQWQPVNADKLHQMEPILRAYNEALFYPTEAHIEPRQVLRALWKIINEHPNSHVTTNTELSDEQIDEIVADTKQDRWLLDCRGYNGRSDSPDLRGVRGEMLHIYNPELTLSRPLRLLHPRIPIYLVPRPDHQFMLGATMIENSSRKHASVRSVMELLSALYTVNSAFAQSEIIEIGVDVRPAYPDNLPKIIKRGRRLLVNGMYRHGYLLAPAFAHIVSDYIAQGSNTQSLSATYSASTKQSDQPLSTQYSGLIHEDHTA